LVKNFPSKFIFASRENQMPQLSQRLRPCSSQRVCTSVTLDQYY